MIALLTLPAAVAGIFTNNLGKMMAFASGLSLFFVVMGLALSYNLNLPAGAVIVIIAGISYLSAMGVRKLRRNYRRGPGSV